MVFLLYDYAQLGVDFKEVHSRVVSDVGYVFGRWHTEMHSALREKL